MCTSTNFVQILDCHIKRLQKSPPCSFSVFKAKLFWLRNLCSKCFLFFCCFDGSVAQQSNYRTGFAHRQLVKKMHKDVCLTSFHSRKYLALLLYLMFNSKKRKLKKGPNKLCSLATKVIQQKNKQKEFRESLLKLLHHCSLMYVSFNKQS